MKYSKSHKNFKFDVELDSTTERFKNRNFLIRLISVEELYARVVIGKNNNKITHSLKKLKETPHYKYLKGDKKAYLKYLRNHGKSVGFGIEHSEKNYKRLIKNEKKYLEGKYSSKYIICEEVGSFLHKKLVIMDGVHRAALLLFEGVKKIPVAVLLDDIDKKDLHKKQLKQYLFDYKDDFKEWYTPLEIAGFTVNERTYPDFKERPQFLKNKERGKSRWDYIICDNLPSLKGKVVCDVGCNVGLYSLLIAKLGAKKVIGYDRGETRAYQPSNRELPQQNTIDQAYFVRNLFMLLGEVGWDKVEFVECDLEKYDFSKFRCDLFFSTCVLYHFGKKKFEIFIKNLSKNVPEIFLQTNLGHVGGDLSELVNANYQKSILEKHGYQVRVTAPKSYNYPVLYGKKKI